MFNLKKIRNIFLFAALLAFVSYIVSICYQLNKATKDDPPVVNNILPNDYKDLFLPSALKKIAVRTSFHYRHRSTISLFTYDDKFGVEMIKIDSSFNIPVNKAIVETFENSVNSSGPIYTPFNEPGFTTNYQSEGNSGINKIYLSIYGDSVMTVIKNDSITSYYLKLKNFSVTYNISKGKAIYVDASQGLNQFSNIPIDVAFLRKNGSLYFLILAPNTVGAKLDAYFLFQLIKTLKVSIFPLNRRIYE